MEEKLAIAIKCLEKIAFPDGWPEGYNWTSWAIWASHYAETTLKLIAKTEDKKQYPAIIE